MIDSEAPESNKPDRRAALVAAAYQRIATSGFEGLRTRDVAADAGVNIATLHYYFPTKEALIRSVVGQAMHRFLEAMPGEGSALEQLRTHLHVVARLLKEDQQLWTVMGELVLRAPRDPDLAHIFQQSDAFWHRTLRDLIAHSIEEGVTDPALDPDGAATLMIAAIKGLSLPTARGLQPEQTDQVFSQFERILGLSTVEP